MSEPIESLEDLIPDEAGADEAESDAPLDALTMSSLLSSRVCHDLINPVGAIGSGLDVLDDPSMDEAMRGAAVDLLRNGARKAIALLTYARLAYGAAGGFGAEISLDDAREALSGVYEALKADLDWRLESGYASKEYVKVVLILGYAASECIPRGGEVVIEGDRASVKITASGKKLYLTEDLQRALAGDTRDIAPKFTPILIAGQMVREAGGRVQADLGEEAAVFAIGFVG